MNEEREKTETKTAPSDMYASSLRLRGLIAFD